jgi:hypothetical protein
MEHLQAESIVLADVAPGGRQAVYNEFYQKRIAQITPLYQMIDRQFYWVSGEYRMLLELRTTQSAKNFMRHYTFSLSETDSNSLRLNIVAAMRATCNMSEVIFNFAAPVYSPANF